jgi:hypothetical protein
VSERRPDAAPEFGPGGYLPERAAKRARKIVLRAPLGMQWIVASVVAGVIVVVAGALLLTRGSAPDPPFVPVADVADVAGQVVHDGAVDALLVGLGGRIRAFEAPGDVAYCEGSRRLESPDGGVWSLTGRSLAGGDSFAEHPTVTADGVLYVDPTATTPPLTPATEQVEPACS